VRGISSVVEGYGWSGGASARATEPFGVLELALKGPLVGLYLVHFALNECLLHGEGRNGWGGRGWAGVEMGRRRQLLPR